MIINMGGGKPEKRYKEITVTGINLVSTTSTAINNYYLDANLGGTDWGNLYYGYIQFPSLDFTPSRVRVEIPNASGSIVWVEEYEKIFSITHTKRMKITSDDTIYMCTRKGGFYADNMKQVLFYANEKLENRTATVKCWE